MSGDDPLDAALRGMKQVIHLAQQAADDPIAAAVSRLGERATAAARLAASAALVSIASDVRRVADHLTATAAPDRLQEALLHAARALPTQELMRMHDEGRRLGGVWPSVMAALAQVLTERGVPPSPHEQEQESAD